MSSPPCTLTWELHGHSRFMMTSRNMTMRQRLWSIATLAGNILLGLELLHFRTCFICALPFGAGYKQKICIAWSVLSTVMTSYMHARSWYATGGLQDACLS